MNIHKHTEYFCKTSVKINKIGWTHEVVHLWKLLIEILLLFFFFTFEESVSIYFNYIGFGCNTVYPWNSKSVLWTQPLHRPFHQHNAEWIMSEFKCLGWSIPLTPIKIAFSIFTIKSVDAGISCLLIQYLKTEKEKLCLKVVPLVSRWAFMNVTPH